MGHAVQQAVTTLWSSITSEPCICNSRHGRQLIIIEQSHVLARLIIQFVTTPTITARPTVTVNYQVSEVRSKTWQFGLQCSYHSRASVYNRLLLVLA
jgi:hypothetical protein